MGRFRSKNTSFPQNSAADKPTSTLHEAAALAKILSKVIFVRFLGQTRERFLEYSYPILWCLRRFLMGSANENPASFSINVACILKDLRLFSEFSWPFFEHLKPFSARIGHVFPTVLRGQNGVLCFSEIPNGSFFQPDGRLFPVLLYLKNSGFWISDSLIGALISANSEKICRAKNRILRL